MCLKSYRDHAKPIQIIFQCLSLPLSNTKRVVQPWGFDLVDQELLSKHYGELREKGDLTIRDPTEPL